MIFTRKVRQGNLTFKWFCNSSTWKWYLVYRPETKRISNFPYKSWFICKDVHAYIHIYQRKWPIGRERYIREISFILGRESFLKVFISLCPRRGSTANKQKNILYALCFEGGKHENSYILCVWFYKWLNNLLSFDVIKDRVGNIFSTVFHNSKSPRGNGCVDRGNSRSC